MELNGTFDFVQFPTETPPCEQLVGHDCLHRDRYHGSLALKLTALTPVSVSAGITALGDDVGESVPLIRVMGQDHNGKPLLQSTSLKGCIRAVYETITNSSMGVNGSNVSAKHEPNPVKGQWIEERRESKLSPAELVFGALGFQGLISIADAVGDRPLEIGYLPPMFQPKQGRGRKFYHHNNASSSTSTAGSPVQSPTPIQQAPTGTVFTTTLRFTNLTLAQLGALLIALGKDSDYPFDLKLGAGKGKGLGSLAIQVSDHQILKGDQLKAARYLEYTPNAKQQANCSLEEAMQEAHDTKLIHNEQLQALWSILKRPEPTP